MALVKGFKEFRKNNIKGVIFNNLSEKLYGDLSEECRKIGLVPLGFFAEHQRCADKQQAFGIGHRRGN